MSYFEIFLLAVALSIDAFVVSFSCGIMVNKKHKKNALKMSFANGFAQFVMPVLGWYGVNIVGDYVKAFDHWIVFLVFLALGVKFIKDALEKKEQSCNLPKKITFKILLIASFATSIDAFAAGISIYFMHISIWTTSIVIGIVTFINSFIGFRISLIFKKLSTKYIEVFAGLILIALGTKTLIEHLVE